MAQVGEINVKIGADTSGLDKGIIKTKENLGEIDKSAKKSSKTLDDVGKSGAIAFAIIGSAAAAAVTSLVKTADQFNRLEVRIKTATSATGDYLDVSNALFKSAQETGVSLESTIAAFQNIAGSAREIGKTNKDVIQFVDSFQRLAIIGGSSTEEINNSLRQMSQSLAGGVLRAEEFNSVVENTPEVARALARGLGLSVGELRNAVNAGTVLSEDIFNALQKQSEQINEQFKQIPLNLGQSGEALSNSIGRALSQLDSSIGLTETIAKSIRGWSLLIDSIAEKEDGLKSIDIEILELRKKINSEQSIFGNNSLTILDNQRKLRDLEQERLTILGAVNKLQRGDVGLNLEAEYNQIISDEMKKQLDNAIEQESLMNKRFEQTKSFRDNQERIAEAAQKELDKQAEKIRLIQEELAWKKAVWKWEADATQEDTQQAGLDKSQKALEDLQAQFTSEQELLTKSYEDKQVIIDEALLNQQLSQEQHEELMYKIQKDYADKTEALDRAKNTEKLKQANFIFGNLSSLMNTKNKEMFEIGKAAATANAVVNTWQGATKALADWGYPFGAIAAAAVVASGAVAISNIQSQSIGGASSAGAAGTFSGGQPAVNTQAAEPVSPQQNVNISLQGDTFSRDSVLSLIDNINGAIDDGARIRVT